MAKRKRRHAGKLKTGQEKGGLICNTIQAALFQYVFHPDRVSAARSYHAVLAITKV